MSETLVALVGQLGPLRSVQARILMYALAHLADDNGDCGAVPLGKLARMAQNRSNAEVGFHLSYLENDLGLIIRTHRPQPEPSLMRINVEVLRNPTAHRLASERQLRAIGGPLSSQLLAAPEVDQTQRKTLYSHRGLFRNRPIVYVPVTTFGPAARYACPLLPYATADRTVHVYRLSPRAWIYSGIQTRILIEYGTSYRAVAQLALADVVTVEELDHVVDAWRRDREWPHDAAGFGQFLFANAYYLYSETPVDREPISERIASSILDAHAAWASRQRDLDARQQPPLP